MTLPEQKWRSLRPGEIPELIPNDFIDALMTYNEDMKRPPEAMDRWVAETVADLERDLKQLVEPITFDSIKGSGQEKSQ